MEKYSLDNIINYLENTTEESWCKDVVKTKEGKSCLLGHLFDMGGNELMDIFEELYATTYMFYPVNDGEHSNYKQPTPKQRCIQYLKDLRDGKEKTTSQLMREYLEIELLKRTKDNVFKN